VVDYREVTEEPIKSDRIRGVESRGAHGASLTGSPLEALGIPAREDHLGPFCTCATCCFESDAGATADHNNGLPEKLRLTVDRRSYGAHRSSDSTGSYENRCSRLVNGLTIIMPDTDKATIFMATLFYASEIIPQK
jgi:hypothetical protein